MQSVPITTDPVGSNPAQVRCKTLCDKVVSDLRQVGGFLRVLRFPPPIKLTATLSIKALVDHLLSMLNKQGKIIHNDDVQWILTVPAIWTDTQNSS
jgi:hypothetical protein